MDDEELMSLAPVSLQELSQFNGLQGDGKIYIAVLGRVFDVTMGQDLYGPQGK